MKLSAEHADALGELINIGVGKAAAALNEMVGAHVSLQVPSIRLVTPQQLSQEIEEDSGRRLATVQLGFSGLVSGTAQLIFPSDSASKLVAALTGEEPGTPDLDSERASTLTEVGNIVINGVMGSIANIIEQHLTYNLPAYVEDTAERLVKAACADSEATVLLAQTHFLLAKSGFAIEQELIEGEITLLFEVGAFDALLARIEAVDSKVAE